MRAAVEDLGAERIGHGIAALRDPSVVEMLAERGIALEICPTSNALTGAAAPDGHAFVAFDRAGCIVTIDADDPALFGTSIERSTRSSSASPAANALARYVAQRHRREFRRRRDSSARCTRG